MAFLYVARGHHDLVKIGRTVNLKRRRSGLEQDFHRFGNELIELRQIAELSDKDVWHAEGSLMCKLHAIYPQYAGREWFTAPFEIACEAARITAEERFFSKPFVHTPYVFPVASKAEVARMAAIHEQMRIDSIVARQRIDTRIAMRAKRRAEMEARGVLSPRKTKPTGFTAMVAHLAREFAHA